MASEGTGGSGKYFVYWMVSEGTGGLGGVLCVLDGE